MANQTKYGNSECATMVKDFIKCGECENCSLNKRRIFINHTNTSLCVFLRMFTKNYLYYIEQEASKNLSENSD